MRSVIAFPCGGDKLFGTLDAGDAATGLLIVSGGNEIRIGAHRGMALLAGRLAASGIPTFRYDRRGVGDSTGDNLGFEQAGEDMAAAAAAFRSAAPQLRRIVGFGNCDAATALAMFHGEAGIDALVLANPWTIEATDDLPPAAAIRSHYIDRLKNPATYLRLLKGGINIGKLLKGLSKISEPRNQAPESLAARLGIALRAAGKPVRIVLATRDATAIAFADSNSCDIPIETIDTGSHSFHRPADQVRLEAILRAALA